MTTDRDTTRIVRSWLSSDEHESADNVLDTVLDLLDATPQRRAWWPAWRIAQVNTYAKLAAAVAAVVVLAVIGLVLFPRSTTSVGGVQSPSAPPAVSPSEAPSLAASSAGPSSAAATFPPDGALAQTRHAMVREGVDLSIAITGPGWSAGQGYFIDKGAGFNAAASALLFWPTTPDNIYSNPCAETPMSPAPATTAAGLAAAVTKVPGTTVVSGPTDVTVGGSPGKHVVIRIPDTLPCAPEAFHLWYDAATVNGRYAQAAGETVYVWIIDHDGTLVWIDGETYKGADPARARELQQIVDSIQFP
jgi:hypothetical protein